MKKCLFIKGRSKASTILKLVFGAILLALSAGLIAASVIFRFDEWHDFDPSLIVSCPKALQIYDSDGNEISVTGTEKRIWVSLDALKKHTVDAFVAAEDTRFYTHSGIDVYRIFGAAWADIKAGGYVQGASTISQQLIKLSHLSSEKTLDRKLEEAVLATQLEQVFSKDEIMEMYLNYIYFGGGFYGIETASLGYFGVHAGELTAAQSAQLAGILKSPSAYAPHLDPEASVSRRNNILRLMHEQGYLTDDEYEAAKAEESVIVSALPNERNALTERAVEEAAELTGKTREELLSSGYSIYTTMDSRISSVCEELMNNDPLFPSENAQAALVVLDNEGGISAVIGGRGEYAANGLNRAADIERKPGSLIKPILVYAPALEKFGFTAATVLMDEPENFGDYSPRNSDDKYYGAVTLRTAVAKSLNIPAVEVLNEIGVYEAVGFASRMGVSFDGEQLGLPLALGGFTYGVSPLEMAGAYSVFAREGLYTEPYTVRKIVDHSGKTVYERHFSAERVMSRENAFILTSMLQSVVSEGTGRRLLDAGLPLAAKTGTAVDGNGVRDAWCAAYTPEHTAVIWMGTDSAELGSLPETAVGGNNTAIILGELFKAIYSLSGCADFTVPEGVVSEFIDVSDMESGCVYASAGLTPKDCLVREYFVSGTAPETVNPYWCVPTAPDDLGWSIGEGGAPVISFTAENALFTYKILRSDMNGEEKQLCAFSGKTGYLSFTDEDVLPGGSYVYRIVALHPELSDENGSPLESESSRKLRVVVPFYY